MGLRVPLKAPPVPTQEYEHLAANLDGARTPLLEKMRAFSPASSKVDLVEAAEAHAQQLHQLALNLSRCEACRVPRGTAGLGGLSEEGPSRSPGPHWLHGIREARLAGSGAGAGAGGRVGPAAVRQESLRVWPVGH